MGERRREKGRERGREKGRESGREKGRKREHEVNETGARQHMVQTLKATIT